MPIFSFIVFFGASNPNSPIL